MVKEFNSLTKEQLNSLRKKDAVVSSKDCGIQYNITSKDIDNAIEHLKIIYGCNVTRAFTIKLILIYLIYN